MSKELVQGIDGKGKKLQSRIWFFSLVDQENNIPKILENLKTCSAVNVFTILHDKDKIRQDDGSIIPKRNHHHFALRFENPTLLSTIANIFELDVSNYNLIQKAKNWKSCCRYMCHLDDKNKYQYPVSDIVVIKGSKDDWYNSAIGKVQYTTTDADLFPFFGDFDKMPFKKQYVEIYNNIDEAKRRNSLLKELNKSYENYLDKKRFEMETKNVKVMFVEGLPGSGKSTFARSLAVSNNKSVCISSSSNDVLQDYTNEDYLILDDLRDTSFLFEDLLKLLDNFVISSVKSRYKNKFFLGEMIIITSAKPLCEWYQDTSEDRQQLFRRINLFARCERKGNSLIANIYIPNDNERAINDYGKPNGKPLPSPILDLTPQMVQSVSETWKEIGIDLDQLAKPFEQTLLDMLPDTEMPFKPKV